MFREKGESNSKNSLPLKEKYSFDIALISIASGY